MYTCSLLRFCKSYSHWLANAHFEGLLLGVVRSIEQEEDNIFGQRAMLLLFKEANTKHKSCVQCSVLKKYISMTKKRKEKKNNCIIHLLIFSYKRNIMQSIFVAFCSFYKPECVLIALLIWEITKIKTNKKNKTWGAI